MVIHVDPKFSRTSARSNFHVPLRSGTDIAFLGGMIKYIIENNKYFKDYVVEYTNAAFLVNKDFGFKDGLFSGFDAQTRKYDTKTWSFQMDEAGLPRKDKSLQDPRCVFQLMKKHYSRYSLDKVSSITGVSKENLLKVYEAYSATGVATKAGTVMYALGWTQHTVGVQNIRSACHGPAAAGQHGHCRRRRERPARRAQCPGLHRPCPALPYPARLPGHAHRRVADRCRLQQGQHPGQQGPQERQLVAEQAQVPGQPAQGLVWGKGHAGQRLLLRPDSQGRQGRGLLLHVPFRPHAPGPDARRFHFRPQPDELPGQHPQGPGRHGQIGLGGGLRAAPFRNHGQLAPARGRPQNGQDRVFPSAFGPPHRKRRHGEQQQPPGALAPQGHRTGRRGPDVRLSCSWG